MMREAETHNNENGVYQSIGITKLALMSFTSLNSVTSRNTMSQPVPNEIEQPLLTNYTNPKVDSVSSNPPNKKSNPPNKGKKIRRILGYGLLAYFVLGFLILNKLYDMA